MQYPITKNQVMNGIKASIDRHIKNGNGFKYIIKRAALHKNQPDVQTYFFDTIKTYFPEYQKIVDNIDKYKSLI